MEELSLLLLDFAGQSDSFLFINQEYKKLIIDDLGSKQQKLINSQIKNIWNQFQILKTDTLCESFEKSLMHAVAHTLHFGISIGAYGPWKGRWKGA